MRLARSLLTHERSWDQHGCRVSVVMISTRPDRRIARCAAQGAW